MECPRTRRSLVIPCEEDESTQNFESPTLSAVYSPRHMMLHLQRPSALRYGGKFLAVEAKRRPSPIRPHSPTDRHDVISPHQFLRDKFRTDSPEEVIKDYFRFAEEDLVRLRGEFDRDDLKTTSSRGD